MIVEIRGVHFSSSKDVNFKETDNGLVSFETNKGETKAVDNVNIKCKNEQGQDFTICLNKDSANIFYNVLKSYV